MCSGVYNGSYCNWSVATDPFSIHLRFMYAFDTGEEYGRKNRVAFLNM